MIPVEQTRSGYEIGNCFEAAVASVLECAIDDVPVWGPDDWDGYHPRLDAWLAERGLISWSIAVFPEAKPLSEVAQSLPPGLYIAGVETTVAAYNHALVARGGEVLWDPSPHRARPQIGLKGEWLDGAWDPYVDFAFVLLPLDPARLGTSRT